MIIRLRFYSIALIAGLVLSGAAAGARPKCESDLLTKIDGLKLYGAYNWLRLAAVDRATDAEGRMHYLLRTTDGVVDVYRAEPAPTGSLRLLPVGASVGRVSRPIDVTVDERTHHGCVVETWTFTRDRSEVVLTFCHPDEVRAAMPLPIDEAG